MWQTRSPRLTDLQRAAPGSLATMNEQRRPRNAVEPARSFDLVADAYDRAWPSYPEEAVAWLLDGVGTGDGAVEVLELGAGTGKLTEQLMARGCSVTATDRSTAMLSMLSRRAPHARALAAVAEQPPVATRSTDLVVAAQAFSWFDAERTVQQAARVLRPGGRFAVVWSRRDERIPWVRRLGRIIGSDEGETGSPDPTAVVDETGMFETVESSTFRFWHPLNPGSLRDLAVSQPGVALMSDFERARVLRHVDELYAEYGRGADGMLLPYVTTVLRTAVLPWALPEEPEPEPGPVAEVRGSLPGEGGGGPEPTDDALLIDFR
jgi:SAM-dependent methyltransferase